MSGSPVDKVALRIQLEQRRAELADALRVKANVLPIEGGPASGQMRDMTDQYEARLDSEIGQLEETIRMIEGLLGSGDA
jgi:hypothetical protein